MKKLTFCLFSAQDTPEEQDRLTICLNSLLAQDTDESKVMFFDCSQPSNKFQVREHRDLLVQYLPMEIQNLNASIIRNEMSLLVDTPIICHVCGDCAYSPAFARKVIQAIGDGNRLVMCRRRSSSQQQWEEIHKQMTVPIEIANQIELESSAVCGECQAMMTRQFIEIGGYFKLIENGKVLNAPFSITAHKEDTELSNFVHKKRQHQWEQHTIEPVWIHDDPDVWIVHLYHKERNSIKYWHTNR